MNHSLPQERIARLTNGLDLCYRSHGDEQAPAVLLIIGLGLQLVYWPQALIDSLVARGLRVVCFDNRDAGRSSRCHSPHPSTWQQLRGRAPLGAYGLEDMADDSVLLLDQLGIRQAHLVGMSLGGMIAQTVAYRYPERVRSLSSIFSSTGHRKVGQPAASMLMRMAFAKRPTSASEAVAAYLASMRHIGGPATPEAEARWAAYAEFAWARKGGTADQRAVARQIGAIFKSGDRTAMLSRIRARSLVLHGEVDRMVHPSGGLATAQAITAARHEILPGMRHEIGPLEAGPLAELLLAHFQPTLS